jgi:hypothetical protein
MPWGDGMTTKCDGVVEATMGIRNAVNTAAPKGARS